jgi:hypothetical protein
MCGTPNEIEIDLGDNGSADLEVHRIVIQG